MDKAIDNIMSPLGQLREEIMVSQPVCQLHNLFSFKPCSVTSASLPEHQVGHGDGYHGCREQAGPES